MTARPIFAALLLAVTSLISLAQSPITETPACNEEFARFLVDQQVSESRNVEQTEKRVRILIRAAEFLWRYDETAARDYLTQAFKVASDRFHEKGFEVLESKGLTMSLPDHRFEVIRAIARKDAEWAKKLIDQVLKEYEKDAERKEFDKNLEIRDIIRVAEESVKTNPELSRFLLRRVMQYPLDYHWYGVLFSIAEENRPFADILYVELLGSYANSTPRRLLFLSAYPFASSRMLGPDKFQFGASLPENLTPNRNLQRQFIETFLQRAISFASDPQNLNLPAEQYRQPEPVYMISAISEIEPIVIQQFPALIQRLSEAKAQVTGMLTEQMRKDLTEREKQNESLAYGFERRLKQLEEAEADGKLTDQMIVSLLTWGERSKTEEQYKQLEPWLAKIKEDAPRNEAINYFWFLRARLAVKENRLEDADRFSRKIPEIEHRAILVFEIAEAQLKNVNDAATVYQTLRDVGRLAEQSETSLEKARILIALTNQYIKINPAFAMQELSDAIKVINRLENVDLSSTMVFRQIKGKNFSSFAGYSLPGHNLEGTFKAISKDNFEMSLSNAKSLEDKYLRTLAVLAVAQNCVERVKAKPVPRKSNRTRGS